MHRRFAPAPCVTQARKLFARRPCRGTVTAILAFCLLLLLRQVIYSRSQLIPSRVQVGGSFRTLRFEVCNGFTNQRISLLYGVVAAVRSGRALVVPRLITDGRTGLKGSQQVLFGDMYDEGHFKREMRKASVTVVSESVAPQPHKYLDIVDVDRLDQFATVDHVSIACPLFSLHIQSHEDTLLWSVLDALVPAPWAQAFVKSMLETIDGGNFLHLRIERDWLEHCRTWSNQGDGKVRDNCMNNSDTMDTVLPAFGFKIDVPLLVETFWDDVDPQSVEMEAVTRLIGQGYQVLKADDILPKGSELERYKRLRRDVRALISYYVALGVERFIGNSVSTFSALIILQRRHAGRWAAYYNGGNIPLSAFLPGLAKLPWVFTHTDPSGEYDDLMMAAVISANKVGTLSPYCILSGDPGSHVARWLRQHGVAVIQHEPAWKEEFVAIAIASNASKNIKHSHLYATPQLMLATFARIDMPVIPELDQYTYVLYTDTDVYFRRPLTLADFGLPLPPTISMGYEYAPIFPFNAGVILANLPALRSSHKAFIEELLHGSGTDAFFYPGYGPGDQGILNKFYETELRAHVLSEAFNSKCYDSFYNRAYIVHFQGPKPHDFLSYLKNGQCRFGDMCADGVSHAACLYLGEWSRHFIDTDIESNATGMQLAVEVFKACDARSCLSPLIFSETSKSCISPSLITSLLS